MGLKCNKLYDECFCLIALRNSNTLPGNPTRKLQCIKPSQIILKKNKKKTSTFYRALLSLDN